MKDFMHENLPQLLQASLTKIGFVTPTPIQALAIPLALEGRDILGSAQTGTGKTGAFAIPVISKLLANPKSTALILTPTRELATQVIKMTEQLLGRDSNIKTALIIGGESIVKQFQALKFKPRMIVGTPGRINDHLQRKTLDLSATHYLVLDETDRMLDMGFGVQLDAILEFLPDQRQTLMFSATLPKNIVQLSKKYLNDPERITVGSTTTPHANITQENIRTTDANKFDELLTQIQDKEGSVIVFVKTKHGADRLAAKLNKMELKADALHGDLRQNKRDRVIQSFRNKKFTILVATDVAARGLDIPHIEYVVNYDLPPCPEDYIHRIGRTARAGASGTAINLITPADQAKWKGIERLINDGISDGQPTRPASRSSRGGGRPGFKSDRPAAKGFGFKGAGKPGFKSDKPAYRGDKPAYAGDKPAYAGGKPAYRGDKPAYKGEKPAYRGDKPAYAGDKPAYRGDKPAYKGEKPAYAGDKPAFRGDKPAYQGDKPAYRGDKPVYAGDKPKFSKEDRNKKFAKPKEAGEKKFTFSGLKKKKKVEAAA